jgi:membrane fusion protein, heavy metal efflux system
MKHLTRRSLACCALLFAAVIAVTACNRGQESREEHADEHGEASPQIERGPHRGRMLRDGAFALELQVFEEGVPPEFRVYLFRNGKALPPDAAQVSVTLQRLDGETNRFAFVRQGDFLRGDGVVHEPHSFSVEVKAQEGSTEHRWTFDSFEGRTTIAAATAESAGVRTEVAGSATLTDSLVLAGRLEPNAEHTRTVAARFPGVIRDVARSIGETVRAGERLATVESNESLETYAVTAPIGGVITERHANPGEATGSGPLFVIADYGALWAELALFPRDLPRVKAGQVVTIKAVDGDLSGEGRIVRVAPAEGAEHGAVSGVYTARVTLDNKDSRWAPGLFVEGRVHIGERTVPLAVKRSALQTFRDFTVVFAQVGETYEVRMLDLGRQDATWAEVLGGLKPGTRYVTDNSYLIKADIEKSGASHDH